MNFIENFIENHPFISAFILLTLINGVCDFKIERSEPDE
jgi:hypothetical protein